ncbi:MAG: hypothetical protein ACFFAH_10055 [Promethearchaeota archaeon]
MALANTPAATAIAAEIANTEIADGSVTVLGPCAATKITKPFTLESTIITKNI